MKRSDEGKEEHERILFSDVCGYFDKEDSCDRRGENCGKKVRTLLKFAEHIEVTAPEICDEMKDILKEEERKEVPQTMWSSRKVLEEDLKDTSDFLNGADIVLDCDR